MQPAVVVVGSANADLVVHVDHRPDPGETILGSDVEVSPGGKGANQAVSVGKLGGTVAFVGCVGADDEGSLLRGSLEGAGVGLTGLAEVEEPTGTAFIMVTPDGENSIVVSPSANRRVTPEVVDRAGELLGRARVVVLQLEIPMATVAHVARRVAGARLLLNAAPAQPLAPEVLRRCDPLVVNRSEAESLLGAEADEVPDATHLAAGLLALGTRSVVVTLGADGAVVAERGSEPAHVPALEVEAVDTTGAGDAFVGALALQLAEGQELREAASFATKVAAVAVTRRGAQSSYPSRTELGPAGARPDTKASKLRSRE
ncbi:MAG: ribokinase [Propionibacterium sp.]|nr:ribokinase [Propionibacterium sp.]